jgi:hypothetical protein
MPPQSRRRRQTFGKFRECRDVEQREPGIVERAEPSEKRLQPSIAVGAFNV